MNFMFNLPFRNQQIPKQVREQAAPSKPLLLFRAQSGLRLGKPEDFCDVLLSLWSIIGGLYYLPCVKSNTSFVRLVPKAMITSRNASKYNLKILKCLWNSPNQTIDKEVYKLMRLQIMYAYPDEIYQEDVEPVSANRARFIKACTNVFAKTLKERFIGAPGLLNGDEGGEAIESLVDQYQQILPQGVEHQGKSDGSSTKFFADTNAVRRYSLASPYFPFWSLQKVLCEYIFEKTSWCMLLYNDRDDCIDVLDLQNYFANRACVSSGPVLRLTANKKGAGSNNHKKYEFILPDHEFTITRWFKLMDYCKVPYYSFRELYYHITSIGKGTFSKVYKCRNRVNGNQEVIKAVEKSCLSIQNALSEVLTLSMVDHPHVLKICTSYCNHTTLCIVTEYLAGGALSRYIRKNGRYSEPIARIAIGRMLAALSCLHSHKIVHRDLKSDNIMLRTNNDPTSVCIIDFGLSTVLDSPSIGMRCGSPGYIAPEVVSGKASYSTKSDLFSLGVILYHMVTGELVFNSGSNSDVMKLTKECDVQLNIPALTEFSDEFKSILGWFLQKDPSRRCSADQALHHPFIIGGKLLPGTPITTNAASCLDRIPPPSNTSYSQCSGLLDALTPRHSYQLEELPGSDTTYGSIPSGRPADYDVTNINPYSVHKASPKRSDRASTPDTRTSPFKNHDSW